MRKNNLIVFGLLSVLSVGGISAAILCQTGLGNNLVTAEVASPCTLKWTAAKPATISNGSGTGLADGGTVTTVYTGAEAAAGCHVKLSSTGSMSTSGLAWDGKTGGVINSIEYIKVEYEKDKLVYEDPMLSEAFGYSVTSPISELKVFYSGTKAGEKIQSGKPFYFNNYLPSDFTIKLSDSSNGDGDFASCWVKIKSVEIGCDHLHPSYGITFDNTKQTTDADMTFHKSNAQHEILDGNYSTTINYRAGDVAAFVSNNPEFICSADSLEITGAAKVEYGSAKRNNKDLTAAYVTFGNSEVAIKVKPWTPEPPADPYPADQYAFIGKYNLYHPETNENVAVELKTDGTYTIGTANGTYKAVDAKNVTFDNPKAHDRPVNFILYDDGFAHLGYALHNNRGDVDASLIGYKDSKVTTVNKGLVLGSSPWQSYLAEISDGTNTHEIFVHKGTVLVNGVKGVQAVPDNPDISSAEIIKITQTLPKETPNAEFDLPTDLDVFYEVVGETKVATTYLRASEGKFTFVKPDTRIMGTYTCEGQPDLVLDGFYHYTLGAETGSFSVDSWYPNVVFTIGTTQYTLNKTTKTYTAVTVYSDPTLGETTKVYKDANNALTLTFNGKGKVTDGHTGEVITYKYNNLSYKGSVNSLPDAYFPAFCYSASLTLEFTINVEGTEITLTKYIIQGYDDMGGVEETPFTTPLTLTLQA